jgi:peptide subunit release factor 1 (eRF1)
VKVLEHGAQGAELDDELRRLVQTAVAEQTVAVLDRFKEERGQADKAADGPAAVVSALQMAMVETLLVHDDPADERVAWFGPEPLQLALSKDDVAGMGVEFPEQARLVDVAVRAAVGSGADVRIVPKAVVTDGFGAVLRAATRPGAPSNEGKDAPPAR